MLLGGDLGLLARVVVAAFVVLFASVSGFVVRRKWLRSLARKEEIRRLLVLASEETARAELAAVIGGYRYGSEVEAEMEAEVKAEAEPVDGAVEVELQGSEETAQTPRRLQYQCEVCFSPTTTRCAQCKAAHYCSGRCQIIHWRQGHKDECRPFTTSDQIGGTPQLKSVKTAENESCRRGIETDGRYPNKPIETFSGEVATSNSNLQMLPNSNENIGVQHHIEESRSSQKIVATSISNKHSVITLSRQSSINADGSVSDLNYQNLSERCHSTRIVSNCAKTDHANVFQAKQHFQDQSLFDGSGDNVADAPESNLMRPNSPEVDTLCGSSTSSVSIVDECNESFSVSSKASAGFWDGTIRPNKARVQSLDDTIHFCSDEGADCDILDSRLSSCCSSEMAGTVVPGVDAPFTWTGKSLAKNLHTSQSEMKMPSTRLASSVEANMDGLKSQRPSMSSERLDHVAVTNLNTRKVSTSRESQDLLFSKDAKATNSSSSSSDNFKHQVDSKISISQEPKVREVKSLSSKASDEKSSSSTGKHATESVNSKKIETVHRSTEGSSNSNLVHNYGNSSKPSMWKVFDQLKTSKLAKMNPLGVSSESVGRYTNKGLFPYDLFVKLYNWNKVELQPCGLINCGNSCYANAVLQCLAFTPPLTAYFLEGLHSKSCKKRDWCFTCEFESLVLKAKEGHSPLSPSRIISKLQNIGCLLGNGREEDAHEFLRYAVDTMQSACLKEAGVSTPVSLEETTLIGLTFGGYLRSKIECMRCGGKSEKHEGMMDLTVEIEGDIGTIEEALRQFTRTEILDGDNKYQCSRCKSYEKARKKLRVSEAPNVLTIALKRFQSGKFGKLNKPIKFPEILDLAPYMSGTSDKSPIYRLYGVVVHLDIMNEAFSGHYVCYVKNTQNKWFKIDDSTVKAVELERVLTKRAYMLLYTRCSPRAPRSLRCSFTSRDPRKATSADTKQRYHTRGSWDVPITQNYDECFCPSNASFQPIRTILEEDSCSDNGSSFFSEGNSCSTDSSNRDSTSTDDLFDQIFRDPGLCWNSSDSETSSSSSSPSPIYSRHRPVDELDHYASRYSETRSSNDVAVSASVTGPSFHGNNGVEAGVCKESPRAPFLCPDSTSTKYCRKVGSSSSNCRESGSSKIGWINRFDKKSSVIFRRS